MLPFFFIRLAFNPKACRLKPMVCNDAFCQVWLNIANWFWIRQFSKVVHKHSISPSLEEEWRKSKALQINKLKSLLPKNALCQAYWIWLSGSRQDKF